MIQVILTYIVNVIIVFVFFPILESVVQYVYPFSWDWLIKPLHLVDKLDVYIIISFALPIIVAIGLFLPPFSWIVHVFKVKENQMQKNLNILNRCLRNYVHLAV